MINKSVSWFWPTIYCIMILLFFILQNEDDMDKEIEIGSETVGKDGERVDPSNFELLKVLGQGSFGKVCLKWLLLGPPDYLNWENIRFVINGSLVSSSGQVKVLCDNWSLA